MSRCWSARWSGDVPRDSLALLFDPALAEKLAHCGIELLDTPQEVIPAALAYLGIDPTSRDLADLDRAAALLDRIRPYVRRFHSSQYINDLAAGDICIALGYSGDVIQARNRAREAESGVEIAFRVPREGAQMSIDMLGIPADAPHPDNAHRFIDYILRPEVIAAITNAVSYPNPNLAATPFVRPADPRRSRDLSAGCGAPAVLYRPAGAARLRAGADARLEPDEVGLLSGDGAPRNHRGQQALRRDRGGRSGVAERRARANSSRSSAPPAAARRRCCA